MDGWINGQIVIQNGWRERRREEEREREIQRKENVDRKEKENV